MAVIEEKKESTVKNVAKKTAVAKKSSVSVEHSDIAFKVLVEPWITEKTHKAISDGKYAFRVVKNATKKQVKLAIEGMYNVKVEKVSAITVLAKKKAYGRHMGKKAGFKKAIITLKKGDKIELFQGA